MQFVHRRCLTFARYVYLLVGRILSSTMASVFEGGRTRRYGSLQASLCRFQALCFQPAFHFSPTSVGKRDVRRGPRKLREGNVAEKECGDFSSESVATQNRESTELSGGLAYFCQNPVCIGIFGPAHANQISASWCVKDIFSVMRSQ